MSYATGTRYFRPDTFFLLLVKDQKEKDEFCSRRGIPSERITLVKELKDFEGLEPEKCKVILGGKFWLSPMYNDRDWYAFYRRAVGLDTPSERDIARMERLDFLLKRREAAQ